MLHQILNLNIEGGRKLNEVISYLKKEKIDIIHLQEVRGGKYNKKTIDVFQTICKELGFSGELAVAMTLSSDPTFYFGNATFFRSTCTLLKKEVIWLEPYRELETFDTTNVPFLKSLPRNALALLFQLGEKKIWFINTHLAWGPTPQDESYKVEQGMKLLEFVSKLSEPFILSGDFNVDCESVIVKSFDKIATNHTVLSGITNTLNPNLHSVKNLFPPGLAVDFIYTSKNLVTKEFQLVDSPDLSDHFGLRLTVEV